MSRCFGTSSANLSAKEYINKKRNTEVFCDLRNKYRSIWATSQELTVACVNRSGVLVTKY